LELEELRALDGRGYLVLDALTASDVDLPPTGSHANPRGFVVVSGETYWVKRKAQDGLGAELIAGRLAARVGAGPIAKVIRVTPEATGTDAAFQDLVGVNVGIVDLRNTINARDAQQFLGQGQAPPEFDARSRARVVVFQTWLGVGDAQVLIDLTDGTIHSIDHGTWCDVAASEGQPQLVVANPEVIDPAIGKDWALAEPEVEAVEGISDTDLLETVACVPQFDPWRADVARRLAIAQGLSKRRDALREVIETWTTPTPQ
jgi:hypothetical protein